jgi:putative transposase
VSDIRTAQSAADAKRGFLVGESSDRAANVIVMRVRNRKKVQCELDLPLPMEWGGVRPGAGRPRSLVHDPEHVARPIHQARHPSHISVRVGSEVGRLRRRKLWSVFRSVALRAGDGDYFRVVHLSIQSNHLHFLVEGENAAAISRGMQRFLSMAAKRINKLLGRRGKVFTHRYHRVDITSPRQMRGALAYVLNNWRRHREDVTTVGAENELVDPYSTAWAFDGWRDLEAVPTYGRLPSASPRSWLLRIGWRRGGAEISVREVPGPLIKRRARVARA